MLCVGCAQGTGSLIIALPKCIYVTTVSGVSLNSATSGNDVRLKRQYIARCGHFSGSTMGQKGGHVLVRRRSYRISPPYIHKM